MASATSSPTTSGTRTDPPSRPPARVSSPAASRPTTSSTASSRPLPILARRARVLGTRPVVGRGRRCAGAAGGSRVASLATVVHPSRLRVSAAPGGAWPPSVVAPAAAAQEAVVSGPLGRRVVARRASSTRRRRGAPMAAAKSEARRKRRVGSGSVARVTATSNGSGMAPATREGGGTRPPRCCWTTWRASPSNGGRPLTHSQATTPRA